MPLSRFFGWTSAKATGKIHAVLEVLEILCLLLVVGFDFGSATVAANWSLAALVASEALRFAYGHRSDKLTGGEAEAKLHAAEAKTIKLEYKLLLTLGPRKIDDEKRARMSDVVRVLAPNSSILIFLCPQKNNEDQREALDFAWQLSEVFGASVCSTNERIHWDIDDIWIRASILDPENVKIGTARVVFGLLHREEFIVHGPIPIVLPDEHVFRYERIPSGVRLASFLTPEEFNGALLIAVGKRSQPVFRLDDPA